MPFDLAAARQELPGRRIEWFQTTDSTMTVASRLAREGCPSGTVVGADQQTAGIGRQGHSWHSEPEAGLYVSIVLRLALGPNALPVMMLALGLAARQAIADVTGLSPDLRWPNDVLLDGKKCAGILAQFEAGAVIAGIGINVSHSSFPSGIAELATSLKLAGAGQVSRELLLAALLRGIDESCRILSGEGASKILAMFEQASSYTRGRRVQVDLTERVVRGLTCGLNADGFLMIDEDSGRRTTILAGGVRPE